MIYGYIRVSTDKQTLENQKFEIKKFAKRNEIHIDRWVEETISSATDLEKRLLGKLLKRLQKGDIVIAAELSRLGRNLLQVMSILHFCMDKNVQVWTIKDNYRLGADIQSKVLAFAFGLSAEIERNLISQRTREALARIRAEGRVLGRPSGQNNGLTKLTGKEDQIRLLLSRNVSRTHIARILGVNKSTLYRFLDTQQIEFSIKQHNTPYRKKIPPIPR